MDPTGFIMGGRDAPAVTGREFVGLLDDGGDGAAMAAWIGEWLEARA